MRKDSNTKDIIYTIQNVTTDNLHHHKSLVNNIDRNTIVLV